MAYIYTKTSEEWKSEYIATQNKLDEVINSDLFGVKSTRNDNDEVVMQDTSEMINALKMRLKYIQEQYELALNYEEQQPKKRVRFIARDEYGY